MLEFAGKTDPGVREGENEDAIGWDAEQGLWFVADGMGGHARGNVASNIAKTVLLEADPDMDLDTQLLEAHSAIAAAADEDQQCSGMGTTAVTTRIRGRSATVSWVGDSRAYLWRHGRLQQITRDHSYLELLRAQNILSEEQLRADPRSNLVTQTLGLGDPQPSVTSVGLRDGDRILLCSDGLNDEVPDEDIEVIISRHEDVSEAVDDLVATALDNGGRDNTSVILIEFRGAPLMSMLGRLLDSRWLPLIIGVTLALLASLVLWMYRLTG